MSNAAVKRGEREQAIKLAIIAIKFGKSLRAAAGEYGIPRTTLLRHKRLNAGLMVQADPLHPTISMEDVQICKRGRPPLFSEEPERAFEKYCLLCSDKFFGLTSRDIRVLAPQFANQLGIPVPDNWIANAKAGPVWFRNFLRRRPNLSMRSPEATSIARVSAFNPTNVGKFFDLLRTVAENITFEPNSIWNLDETGVTTVQKPQRVASRRGVKRVGRVTSADRGPLVTMVLAVSATGNKMPPFFVFPRKRFHPHFLDGGPTGCAGAVSNTGWMNADIYLDVLRHFKAFTRVSKENPLLLIVDNHGSHRSLPAIEFCRDNGIHLLTIPPHCSHRLQPLDVSVFSPFKHAMNVLCDEWTYRHPGKPMSIFDLPAIIDSALERSATERNIKAGFRASGIWPFNPDVFTALDYAPSSVTGPSLVDEIIPGSLLDTLCRIRPIPRAPPRATGRRGRKPGRAAILTDPAEIALMEQNIQAKGVARPTQRRVGRPRKATVQFHRLVSAPPRPTMVVIKRPPGRPRKSQAAADKRPVGRPRKPPVVILKRPVGRPPKSLAIAKRPVGRPPKYPTIAKRPVGRPPKYPTIAKRPVGRPAQSKGTAKRPVGRPRKIKRPVGRPPKQPATKIRHESE
ncbi:uncharacterized protein LOC129717115 [Wyeomyia smithii]|uniref:uncharacterized protein LOC129717115 n=1 Tax=Wyeomyia smithii TaxID=174621 RepID=UPI002467CCE0|nr:uncharacterized protein LOC129717115 [Wyeomyia smithii]